MRFRIGLFFFAIGLHLVANADDLTASEAAGRVMDRVRTDHVYASWTRIDCLSFEEGKLESGFANVTVREKHDGRCVGEPSVAPVVDFFKVNRKTGEILWLDLTKEEPQSWDDFIHSRRGVQ